MVSLVWAGILSSSTVTASDILFLTVFTSVHLLVFAAAARALVPVPWDHCLLADIPREPTLFADFVACPAHAPGMSAGSGCWLLSVGTSAYSAAF